MKYFNFKYFPAAKTKLQRVATSLLHLFPSPRRLLRPEHVRRSRGGELPQVSRRAGEGGESSQGHQEGKEDRGEKKE